ncbi:MAG: hypothetical protein ACRDQZ_26960 [Mycobacteriales bacterium]
MTVAARITGAIAATVGLGLLAASCGGSSGSHVAQLGTTATQTGTSASRTPASALAFSHCMRSHGLSQFPDPDSSGTIPKVSLQQLGVGSSQLQGAQTVCGYLLQPTTSQVAQTLSGMVAFAHCMRSHGVHAWPDPTTDGGQPVFDLHERVNPDSHQMDVVSGKCAHLLQPAPGQNGTVLCNGVGETGCHHYG